MANGSGMSSSGNSRVGKINASAVLLLENRFCRHRVVCQTDALATLTSHRRTSLNPSHSNHAPHVLAYGPPFIIMHVRRVQFCTDKWNRIVSYGQTVDHISLHCNDIQMVARTLSAGARARIGRKALRFRLSKTESFDQFRYFIVDAERWKDRSDRTTSTTTE